MFHETPELPSGFSGEVRLFPLPDLVFFPFNVQPLHIFESRYREMLEDAIQEDQLICMATLEPGFQADYYGRPPVAPHVCIGSVSSHKRRDDGTYDLVLVGFWRALIESEIVPVKSFRRAQVEVLCEDIVNAQELLESPDRDLATRLVERAPSTEELVKGFVDGKMSLNGLTDILAFHLPFDREFKLTLLAETNAVKRAHLLLDGMSNLDDRTRDGQEPPGDDFPPPFSGN